MEKTFKMVSPAVMWTFFSIGILSAFAFRFLIVFHHIRPDMVRLVWYMGVGGYTMFFFYRYEISRKRKIAVNSCQLLDKISRGQCLEGQDREAAEYLFRSITRSKEDINYLAIFVLSIVAVLIDLALTFGRS
jgi:lipid-A-disaccharide synthase-like uncharacterized protein